MTATTPLLTLIVPTYKRAASLELLLRALRAEVAGHEHEVAVIVTDNASPDRTPEVTAAAQADWPSLVVQRHERNLGNDENFCSALDRVRSRWFWIVCDDDLPCRGLVRRVLELLQARGPALVYLPSLWVPDVTAVPQPRDCPPLHAQMLDAATFARRVHVWLTFLSGVVVDRERLQAQLGPHTIRRFHGSYLVQLGWILPLLQEPGTPFALVHDRRVLATKDNSGGYPLLTVFGVRFARIVHACLGRDSALAGILVRGNLLRYLPGRIWAQRVQPDAAFDAESPWPDMRRELRTHALFWLLILPLVRFPRWLAQPAYQSWRVFHRIDRELSARRARAAGVAEADAR